MPICVTVTGPDLDALQRRMGIVFSAGADMVELRLDRLLELPSESAIERLVMRRQGPVIVTVRREIDGGGWRGDEEVRREMLLVASASGAEWIDVESDVAGVLPWDDKAQRVVSLHDFDGTPDDLPGLLEALAKLPGHVLKVAAHPQSWADVVRMLTAAQQHEGPAICVSMGRLGGITRLLAGRFGAPWSYAAPDEEPIAAPGQLRLRQMAGVHRYERIGPDTTLFGVLGDPVAHSLSPAVHNAAFALHEIDAAYVALHVPSIDLPGLPKTLEKLGFAGFSVTIPHKQRALDEADAVDEIATAAGAANTLLLQEEGGETRWWATNTDLPAAIEAIAAELGGLGGNFGKTALLLGSGGVARGIALGLAHVGASVVVAGRTVQKARALALSVGGEFVRWEQRGEVAADIVVNCTPVGMAPETDSTPMPRGDLQAGQVVMDTVYTPERTRLVQEAEQRGCNVVTGVRMFVEQAALQYELFTDEPAPRELMGEVVRRELLARQEAPA